MFKETHFKVMYIFGFCLVVLFVLAVAGVGICLGIFAGLISLITYYPCVFGDWLLSKLRSNLG